jgi:hypothetical protein
MEIHKVIYSDGSEVVFEKKPLEYFSEKNSWQQEYHFKSQIITFEQKHIFPNLKTDLENYAKNEYDLIDENDQQELNDYSDFEIEYEFISRNLKQYKFENENIINKDFLSRFVNIVNRGNNYEIDSVLEALEKTYHIK